MCPECKDRNCCTTTPPPSAVTVDEGSTPTTIAAGNHAHIYITGGCAPYTYSVSGTGYTWASSGLDTLTSNNLNEQLNCAAGTCGTEYGVSCTVTVTDACSTNDSFILRNTAGTWALHETGYAAAGCIPCGEACGTTSSTEDIISGVGKWVIAGDIAYATAVPPFPACSDDKWYLGGGGAVSHPPSCGNPSACALGGGTVDCSYTVPPEARSCWATGYTYYVWSCP
jgi:hypothetical protein